MVVSRIECWRASSVQEDKKAILRNKKTLEADTEEYNKPGEVDIKSRGVYSMSTTLRYEEESQNKEHLD